MSEGVNTVIDEITIRGARVWQGKFRIDNTEILVVGKDHIEVRKYLDEQVRFFLNSGLIVTPKGIALNTHIIDGSPVIRVTGKDSKTAELIFNQQVKRLREITETIQ